MSRKFVHEQAYRNIKDIQAHLADRLIVICGAGAIGSNLTDILARQGCSKIRVIDFDRVDITNVGGQLFGESDDGAKKVAALKARIFRDTGVEIDAIDKRMDESNVSKLVKGASLIVDAFDNSASRRILKESDYTAHCIHAGMFEGYAEVVWNSRYKVPADAPDAVDACEQPLARNMTILCVAVLAEEIMDFLLEKRPRYKSWSITLKDLKISEY